MIELRSVGIVIMQYNRVLMKRGNLDTKTERHAGRTPREDKGRAWSDASTNQRRQAEEQ